MAKRIKNPIEVKATVSLDDNGAIEQVEDVSVHYGLECEHGDLGRKGLPLEQNQTVENVVKDFVEEALRQASKHEEIEEA